MSELEEQMYCSQQICIPPTYPYLLRQFAKAAIRTQPNDLLKWACAYFRCLSLNIPPPVKPRLEYPIPKDYHGLTPGWLKALLHQLEGHSTVSFKVLWDRWIGACLEHNNLIQILCLGGFDDNTAVPWLKFIALCAAHLTENLTQTMILVCEILTEEPEGGSSMIPLQTFIELYEFLARIDASVPQTLKNYYFLDKFLDLYQEKIARDQGVKEAEPVGSEEMSTLPSSSTLSKSEKEERKDDGMSAISCPSVTSQDPDNFMKLLMKIQDGGAEGEDGTSDVMKMADNAVELPPEAPVEKRNIVDTTETEKDKLLNVPEDKLDTQTLVSERDIDVVSRDTRLSTSDQDSKKSLDVCRPKEDEEKAREQCLMEDLERLKALHRDMLAPESDDEIEKFKASILAEVPPNDSQLLAPEHFQTKIEESESEVISESTRSEGSTASVEQLIKEKTDEVDYEDVFVEAIPGIGAKVPEELIKTVCEYMKEASMWQHDMVMPRNIRHYDCPPLQIIDNHHN